MSPKILIATQGSDFKNNLVAAICDNLDRQKAYIKVIDVNRLDGITNSDWARIVVLNTVMMNKVGSQVKDFLAAAEAKENILAVITAGGADFLPNNFPVDGISGASRMSDTSRLADLITDWINNKHETNWIPEDTVVAMEYFLQFDPTQSCQAIRANQEHYKTLYSNLSARLNRVGYKYLKQGKLAHGLNVFKLNVELFPDAWNVYDSYAEALLAGENKEAAIANYRKSLQLNPKSQSGKQALDKLGVS